MADLKWTPDGEEIFKKLTDAIPEAMREAIKPKLLEMLAARAADKPVTSEIVTEMVKEDLPEPQKSALMAALGIGAEKKESTDEPDAPKINWSGKSEMMFEIMLGEVPEAMRGVFRGKLSGVIIEKCKGGPATEDHVTEVVNQIVPDPFKSNILKKFKELGDFDINIIDEIIERHGTSEENLMYILHDAQDAIGYLPIEAISAISNKCDIKLSAIHSIVTFYKAFKLEKPGKHHIKICKGTACHLNDTDNIADMAEDKCKCSDTTVEKTLCLGCCDCSPAFEIDGKIYKGDEAKSVIETL